MKASGAASPQATEPPEQVYDKIRRAIVEGRYAPRQRLVEQRLAEEFDVSRTPVREAFRRLEADGLIVIERNRGAAVRQLTTEEIADLYDVRSRLEAYAAELAATRADDRDLATLDTAVEEFGAAVKAIGGEGAASADIDLVRRLDEANATFHGALLDASGHTRIHQLVGRAVDVPLVFRALRHFGTEQLERSNLFHHLIRDAVAAREPVRAGRLMAEHVLQGRDGLVEQLAGGQVAELVAHRGAVPG